MFHFRGLRRQSGHSEASCGRLWALRLAGVLMALLVPLYSGAQVTSLGGVAQAAATVAGAVGEVGADSRTLNVAFDARPRSVDPRYVSTDANSQYLEPLLFLPLFGFSATGESQGIVAESFIYSDPKALSVKIRDGLRFGLGRNIDADDVVETYKFVLGQSGSSLPPSPRKGVFERVASVEKVSRREVRFVLREPDASLISNLVVGILPREAIRQPPDEIFKNQGFESGPFALESQDDFQWVLRRNSKYTGAPFGGALPQLERVVFKILTDTNTRYSALLKGDVDLVQNSLDTDKVAELMNKRSGDFSVQLKTSDSTAFLAFNTRTKLLADPRVRRAIALGLNRQEILRFTLQGMGQLADSMFPPGHAYHYAVEKPFEPNLREAEMLLDAAGFADPDGAKGSRPRAEFSLKVPLNRERIAVAKAIAGQLKKIGLKVKVEVLEFSTFMKHLNDGNTQAWIAPWTGYKDGDHLHFVFHSSRIPPHGANRGFYVNKTLDDLLSRGKSEGDLVKRKEIYQKAQKIISEDLPYVFLWHRVGHAVTRKGVEGFQIYPDGRYVSLTSVSKR